MRVRQLLAALLLAAAPLGTGQAQREARGVGGALRGAARALDAAAEARETRRATDRYDPYFRKYTRRYFGPAGDWRWFKAQGMAESDLTPTARSRVGARGIMQLMPSTYGLIRSALPHFGRIDDPEWNIAAGILHDADLFNSPWARDVSPAERLAFMFGAYNAGEGPIVRARRAAQAQQLDHSQWPAIERVAPGIDRWRYPETLDYVRRIRANRAAMPTR